MSRLTSMIKIQILLNNILKTLVIFGKLFILLVGGISLIVSIIIGIVSVIIKCFHFNILIGIASILVLLCLGLAIYIRIEQIKDEAKESDG